MLVLLHNRKKICILYYILELPILIKVGPTVIITQISLLVGNIISR